MIKLELYNRNSEMTDISNLVSTVTWSGDYKQASRKLDFELLASEYDNNLPTVEIDEGYLVIFYENDKELFRGTIYGISKRTNSNFKIIAYDFAQKTVDIKVAYNFKNMTASDITNKVLKDYGFNVGSIASDGVPWSKIFINNSIYDVIMSSYTNASVSNNKKYMLMAEGNKINTILKGDVVLEITFKEGKNIITSSYTSSIKDMVNKVLVVDENGNTKTEYSNGDDIELYGLFQSVLKVDENKDTATEAKKVLKKKDMSASVRGYGDTSCITGYGVTVEDNFTGLKGLFYIDTDKHTWSNGEYSIDLNLNFENLMNEVTAGSDEKENVSSNNGDIVSILKSKVGCPYVWGATGPNSFDCSGLAQWAFKQLGISIPRTTWEQYEGGTPVSTSNLKPGDLILTNDLNHVVIYIGNGQIIHSPQPGDSVKIVDYNSYWRNVTVGVRRYL